MKNVNVFVDVDLTIVDHNGNLIEGASKALRSLHERPVVERGCRQD
jgi:hypothetical protein